MASGPASGRSLTRNCSLCSPATASTSWTYSGNPSSLRAFSMCSVAMVFLVSFSAISFASEDMRVMNSTLQSMRRSRASRPKVNPDFSPRISAMIFWIVAAEPGQPENPERHGVDPRLGQRQSLWAKGFRAKGYHVPLGRESSSLPVARQREELRASCQHTSKLSVRHLGSAKGLTMRVQALRT
jgi:hypothetical protein